MYPSQIRVLDDGVSLYEYVYEESILTITNKNCDGDGSIILMLKPKLTRDIGRSYYMGVYRNIE